MGLFDEVPGGGMMGLVTALPTVGGLGRIIVARTPSRGAIPITQPQEYREQLARKVKTLVDQDEEDSKTRVLRFYDAAECVDEAMNTGLGADFARALLDTIASANFGGKVETLGDRLAKRIIECMRKKLLQQDRDRIAVRVTQGGGKRGRPKKGSAPEPGYAAKRRGGAGSKS